MPASGHVPYDAKMSAIATTPSTSLRSLRSLRSSTSSTSSTSSISPVIPPAEHKPSLYDLPLDVLRIIAGHYRELQRQDAASTLLRPSLRLQAALRRHVLTRCEHPRHACRTNTPGEGPVPCYRACRDCHEHPRRLRCAGLRREEYFERIIWTHTLL